MSFWKTISDAIYKEYDRRIRRASLITEYGAHDHHDDHADDSHAEAEDEAEIVNVPRGTVVAASQPAAEGKH